MTGPRCKMVLLVVLLPLFGLVSPNPDAKRLYDILLSNYDRLIRPVANSSDKLTVKMGIKLSQVIGVDMKRQILTTNVWVLQEWRDYKLSWNPAEYGGVKHLHVPSQDIWLPDIVLYNNADGNYEITIMTKAILHYDGKVLWNPPAIYKSYCSIDVEFFPFDQQVCRMKFGSWTYDGFMVDLRHINQGDNNNIPMGMDLRDFYISTEWDVMEVPAIRHEEYYTCCEEPYPDIVFSINLRRKTLFYTVNLIIPCVFMSFLSVLVFYLPSDSGEKVSLSISILLSLTVFFLLLAEIIPPTSLSVPLLGKYLLFTMSLVTFSVVVTIIVLNVNFRTPAKQKMAPWVKKTFLEFLPRYLFIQRPDPDPDDDEDCPTVVAGYNIVFPETLEDPSHNIINAPKIIGHHAEYDGGGGFRLGPPPQLELDSVPPFRLSEYGCEKRLSPYMGGGYNNRFDSGFRMDSIEQDPQVEKAINAVRFVAQHVKNENKYNSVVDDWRYVAMVLDRILLWVFTILCISGTSGIILVAPSLYDTKTPLDIQVSKLARSKYVTEQVLPLPSTAHIKYQ